MSALATLGMTSTAAQAAARMGALPASRERRPPRVEWVGFTCVLPLRVGADRSVQQGRSMATMLARSCRTVNTFDTLAK
ncbi:hypothetical protein Kpho02_19810 [Kitasatospora phosalacinea]|uniref:Secreted protein n=1 Tax=Kitasatospora phosalacinea TaxID=2065 RepID=A0A9W6Q4I9_9ACTN|nr:hypothetical protein Kpho02_19810 [Kitasatospora phosalacinea]